MAPQQQLTAQNSKFRATPLTTEVLAKGAWADMKIILAIMGLVRIEAVEDRSIKETMEDMEDMEHMEVILSKVTKMVLEDISKVAVAISSPALISNPLEEVISLGIENPFIVHYA